MTEIDKHLVSKQFGKGLKSYAQSASVQKCIVEKLLLELAPYIPQDIPHLLEIGAGTGFLTEGLIQKFRIKHFTANDITTISEQKVQAIAKAYRQAIEFIIGDAEHIVLPQNLDLIISSSTVQWFKNIQQFLNRSHQALHPKGILAFSTFGKDNFKEIKAITGLGLDYLSLAELSNMLSADFKILYMQEWTETKQFDTPIQVLKHMKSTGVNALSQRYFGKKQLKAFVQDYHQLAKAQDDQIQLTYHPIIIIAQKK